ncbi:hypothetical protein LWI29_030475 [Acer saccharum]|uniref:1-phosphatidylinositol 4-kinase n=1 Tax=Acer saccharum TaxID=4024 RepID=A0AA39SFK8_ACESA|nr:hypothetical protein LWI29_030475 [Acer saccharum]
MSPKFGSPVQTQMVVAVFNGPCNNEYYGNLRIKPAGTRRVFVQTENGRVLGMDSLTFGDLALNNDLSAIRKDSAILLTRNAIHRSSSTPCLSPTEMNYRQRDQSGPIEPTDEEPFAPNNPKGFVGKALGQPRLKRSVRVGETGYREVTACLLDYDHFANVPPTVLVKIMHIFNLNDGVIGNKLQKRKKISKIASLQQFIPHDFDASDYGASSFLVTTVHKIEILDFRIFNTDRHAGNLLVWKLDGVGRFGQVELIPIVHGPCLLKSLEDPYFEWMHWPQASIPFSEDELDYIKNLDLVHDSKMLQTELPMIREACLCVLVLCTIFLQEAADFGLCLAEIGEMMSKEFHGDEEEPSELEVVCLEARKSIVETKMSFFDADVGEEGEFLFDIDCEDPELDLVLRVTRDISIEGSFNYGNEVEEDEKPIGAEKFSVETHSNWL